MKKIFAGVEGFIKNVRRADDGTKKRWLAILSGTGMLIVIALWVVYFNATLPRTAGSAPAASSTEQIESAAPEGGGGSFFKTLGLGWESVWKSVKDNAESIKDAFDSGWRGFKERLNRTNELNWEKPSATSTGETMPQNQASTPTGN